MRIGLDIGSTTIKAVVLDADDTILFESYERHYSRIAEKAAALLRRIQTELVGAAPVALAISGSGGMGLADACGNLFVQEVYATRVAAQRFLPDSDVIIELGGEDAKILFLTGGIEVRMNGSCAGGTGAFIDQMATLLQVTPADLNELAATHEKRYTIASRCGVFAKSDIQPLLNQGAAKSDIAASILFAVVNQTIAGLAQGRPIAGNIVYLGGPLTFLSELRAAFDEVLGLGGLCPDHSLSYVALGTALLATETAPLSVFLSRLGKLETAGSFASLPPLFTSETEYQTFITRHQKAKVTRAALHSDLRHAYLGVDAGSTTIKMALLSEEGAILDTRYRSNEGDPVPFVAEYLAGLYRDFPKLQILAAAVTGYGEEMLRAAFGIEYGVVETVAHFTAAKAFLPSVDFILDIGGQDIKCFQVKNGAIDNIYLNEACSSGCGSFLQTFANAMGDTIADFAKRGLFADRPVNLGSRCTVFMNSSVKQAQKDGASTANISAGLSISVVKNALYKVIRPSSAAALGERIVVQGGTFYNDAVLRAFEQELGLEVIRPDIAGLMGAYGAALYARAEQQRAPKSATTLTAAALADFRHSTRQVNCGLCPNHCRLTVHSFGGNRSFLGGNRCERPITHRELDDSANLPALERQLLANFSPMPGNRGTIGLPLGLNFYELLPFWHTFFTQLGFTVVTSPVSDRGLYLKGQSTIPSDTVCFPAKLMHGHILSLLEQGVDTIFYPCMSYNVDEGMGDNCYNCPVVAYYPEVIAANVRAIAGLHFIYDYVGLHRRRELPDKLYFILRKHFIGIQKGEITRAVHAAFAAYERYMEQVTNAGAQMIAAARANGKPIIVLAGRPYHLDPEINHGIDRLIAGFGAAVVTAEAVAYHHRPPKLGVLNQWTYHSRLYAAAEVVANSPDMQLVQLVSFGCGCDAVTTDECRSLLESRGKIYTQLKIDEITNLGAVKIRLRSLFAAIHFTEEKRECQ